MNISKLIDLYKKKRITQEELANSIGMSKTALNSILTGKSDPQVSTIEKIANALNVPVGYFFDENTSNTQSGNIIIGNKNKMFSSLNECEIEVMHLKELLKSKEEIINILKKQLKH